MQTSQTAGSQISLLIKTIRSVKISDSIKLSNRSLLKFKHWEITIHIKLRVNHDHFETEEAKIFYIYDHTEGNAQKHLYSHCKPDALWPFKTASEVIQYLAKIYRDPYRVWNTGLEYQALKMKISQPFHEFKTRFLQLADEVKIAENLCFYNLYDKLTISLQNTVKTNLQSYSDDLEMLYDDAAMLDDENKRISARWIQEKKDHTPAVISNTLNSTFEAFWHTASLLIRKQEAAVLTSLCIKAEITDFISLKSVICFNCSKVKHFASFCPESRHLSEVKEIEGGEEDNKQSGKEDT